MKFLCDVHISYKIANSLKSLGFEAIHVNEILDKWNTKDKALSKYADENDLIVLTKDVDFKNSFLISSTPKKLVKINLGNISNKVLLDIISANLQAIQNLNLEGEFLMELDPDSTTFIKKTE